MRFVSSGVPSKPALTKAPQKSVDCGAESAVSKAVKGRGAEHAKVYPFKVCLPRYACWRAYVRTLLNQLKACPECRAAAAAFPIASLPKVHTLPSGKVLVFKGLAAPAAAVPAAPSVGAEGFSMFDKGVEDCASEATCSLLVGLKVGPTSRHQLDQSLDPMTEARSVEEYDMVSIDPNCPRHGKYSLSAWLAKEGNNAWGGAQGALTSKSREHKLKRLPKSIKAGRPISLDFWNLLDKFYKQMLDKDGIETQAIAPSAPRKRKSENLEPNVLKQIETNMATKSSPLSKKQLNIKSTYNNQKSLVSRQLCQSKIVESTLLPTNMSRKEQCNSKDDIFQSNDNEQTSSMKTTTSLEMIANRETQLPPLLIGNDYANKGFGKDVCKVSKSYASQYKRMCHLKGLNYQDCCDSSNQVVHRTMEEKQPPWESMLKMEIREETKTCEKTMTNKETQMSGETKASFTSQVCMYEENENLVNDIEITYIGDSKPNTSYTPFGSTQENPYAIKDKFDMKELKQLECVHETRIKLEGEPCAFTSTFNTFIPTWFPIEEEQMASDLFDVKEFEHVGQQLECAQHENDNLVNEVGTKLIGDEPSACLPIWFIERDGCTTSGSFGLIELEQAREQMECVEQEKDDLFNDNRINLEEDETNTCISTWLTKEHEIVNDMFDMKDSHKNRQKLECVQFEKDGLLKLEQNEWSIWNPSRFTMEGQEMENNMFDVKELEQTTQQLEKIASTAKSLQLGLKDHSHHKDIPIEKVHLTKVKVVNKNETQEWLSNIAIERATNKILQTCNRGRVRQLVQAFESIK